MTRFYALTATLAAFILLTACGGGGIAPLGVPLDGINDDRVTGLQHDGLEGESGGELLDTRTTFGDFCAQFPGYALCSMTHDEYLAQLYPQASPASTRRGGFFSLASSEGGARGATTEVDYIDWSANPPSNVLTGITSRGDKIASGTVFDSGYLLALERDGDTVNLDIGGATNINIHHALTLGVLEEGRPLTDDGVGFIRSRTSDLYAGVLGTTRLAGPVVPHADTSAIWTGVLDIIRPSSFRVQGYNNLELLVNYTAREIDTAYNGQKDDLALGDRRRTPASFTIDGSYTTDGVISGTTTLTPLYNHPSTSGTLSGLIGSTDGTHDSNRLLAAFISDADVNNGGKFVGGFVAKPVPAPVAASATYSDWVAAESVPEATPLADGAGVVRTFINNLPDEPVDSGHNTRRWLNLATFDSEKGFRPAGSRGSPAILEGLATAPPPGQANGVVITFGQANPLTSNDVNNANAARAALPQGSATRQTIETITAIAVEDRTPQQITDLAAAETLLANAQGYIDTVQQKIDSLYFASGLLFGTDLGAPATGTAGEVVTWNGRVAGFWGTTRHSFSNQQLVNAEMSLCIDLGNRVFAAHSGYDVDCSTLTDPSTVGTDIGTETYLVNRFKTYNDNDTLIRFNGGWNADGVINSGDVRLTVPLNTRGDTVVIDGADTTLTGLVGELGAVGAFHGSTGTASSSLHFAGGFVAKPSE